ESWEGVDRVLFERLRKLRREIAAERGVPPFVLFSDSTLRDMARVRPGSPNALLRIRGIGERKAADLGPQFLEVITSHCNSHGLNLNSATRADRPQTRKPNDSKSTAFEMFSQGESIERVAEKTGRSPSTACVYLVEFIQNRPSQQLTAWVDEDTYRKVAEAASDLGTVYLKP